MNTSYYEKKYIECLKKREEELIKLPMPNADREAYLLYFETGNRLEYEKIYFDRREYLTVFGMAGVIFKTLNYERLFEVLESVLNEPTWVLPAHGSREHIEGEKHTIDLFAAETAGTLAEIIYLITDKNLITDKMHITGESICGDTEDKESSRIYFNAKYISVCMHFFKEIRKRIFDIFLSECPCDWWENASMNWSAVCSGNVGIAAYYIKKLQNILQDKLSDETCYGLSDNIYDKLADKCSIEVISDEEYNTIMNRVTDSMICYLKSMGNDGACSEGVGYYKYGMEYFLKFYEILRDENRQENINKIGDFHNVALFLQKAYLGCGNSVNFSDCQLKNKLKPGILCMLSSIYEDVKINEDFVADNSLKFDTEFMEILGGEECHRWLGAYCDYVWVKTYGKNLKTQYYSDDKYAYSDKESFSIFQDTQWYIKRWNRDTCFYIKGGHNDESHNHNDVGSFGFIFKGEEILCDLGAGEYTKDYFGDGRYDILCNSSRGHNVPVIDELYQKSGKIHHADEFYGDEGGVRVSFGMTYDIKKEYTVKRKVIFGEAGSFFVCDHIEGADKISERLITRIKPEIKDNTVILDNVESRIYIDFHCGKEVTEDFESGAEALVKETKEADKGLDKSLNISLNKSDGIISVMEDIHVGHSGQKEKIYIISYDYICDEDFGNKSGKKKDVVIKLFSNSKT